MSVAGLLRGALSNENSQSVTSRPLARDSLVQITKFAIMPAGCAGEFRTNFAGIDHLLPRLARRQHEGLLK
jgi:hypothetical protein